MSQPVSKNEIRGIQDTQRIVLSIVTRIQNHYRERRWVEKHALTFALEFRFLGFEYESALNLLGIGHRISFLLGRH
jgi:hypothetical protein